MSSSPGSWHDAPLPLEDQCYVAASQISIYENALESPIKEPIEMNLVGDSRPAENCFETVIEEPVQCQMTSGCTFMNDGNRKIDFVLAYNEKSHKSTRDAFEGELIKTGLVLEYTVPQQPNGLAFVKLHAPWNVLSCYAEIMHFRMPVKEWYARIEERNKLLQQQENVEVEFCDSDGLEDCTGEKTLNASVETGISRMQKQFSVPYSQSKEYLFDIPERKEDFFTAAQRSQIVNFILQRITFSIRNQEKDCYGINRLLADSVYLAAFPLHEGSCDKDDQSVRYLLQKEWASVFSIFKHQPLDDIRKYFGVKIGLYFAWLGFYTYMLIPASVVGLLCFLYGVLSLPSHGPCNEICDTHKDIVMCPVCDNGCEYWNLGDTCTYSKLTYLFDNGATIVFSVFMSLWGATFLELWKRYSARITYQWDLSGFDTAEENPRPEYIARIAKKSNKKINLINQLYEDSSVPFWKQKVPYSILSCSTVLFLVMVAVAAVVGVILYRMSVRTVLAISSSDGNSEISSYIPVITSSTAALLNLLCILLFNQVYSRVAVYLTELEMPRTQTEYDDSLTLKMYALQFVNCYSSIFYIALFKGKFVGRPGKYTRFLGKQQEECGTGGCFLELSIQLAIIMVGKQAINAVTEMGIPYLMKLWKWWSVKKAGTSVTLESELHPWEKDYTLPDMGPTGLFMEYLEMVLQYGFLTVFVAAFPLGPLFALLNNTLEIRLDARKLLQSYRRPVGQRVRDIGIWYRILDSLGKLAVLSNAVIIAFTSDIVTRVYYQWVVSPDFTLDGYVNFTLSYFERDDYRNSRTSVWHRNAPGNETKYCRYSDFRSAPWDVREYKRTSEYWRILVWKFAFVVIFENVIAVITTVIRWIIPDVPRSVRNKIRQDSRLTQEIIILQELKRKQEADVVNKITSSRKDSPRQRRKFTHVVI